SHAHRIFAGTPQASLTPTANDVENWPVDLGDIDDLRTLGATGPVKIRFETGTEFIELGYGDDSIPDMVDLAPSYFLYPKPDTQVEGRATKELQNRHGPGVIGETGIGETRITQQMGGDAYEVKRLNRLQWQESGVPSIVILDGLLLRSVTHEGGTSRPISSSAVAVLESLFNNLAYLRPTRKRPSRTYPHGFGKPQRIGYAGEWTATILQLHRLEPVKYVELPNIPRTIEEARLIGDDIFAEKSGTLL